MTIPLPADVLNVLSKTPQAHVTGLSADTESGTTYYLAEVDFENESARVIISATPGQPPTVVLADTALVPFRPDVLPVKVLATFANQFPLVIFAVPDPQLQAAENQIRNGMAQFQNLRSQEKLFQCARLSAGVLPSKSVPGTNNGHLACAWAVNEVANLALAQQIGGGLFTADMFQVLHTNPRYVDVQTTDPGGIVISPTEGANIGHVGIIGNNAETYSNSSSVGQFEQNYDVGAWRTRYQGKGLSVHFFNLTFN